MGVALGTRHPFCSISFIFMQFLAKSLAKQECIPGCVPPALYLMGGEQVSVQGVSPGRVSVRGVCVKETPLRGQTDACENITFPQTSFAGGNNFAPNSEVDALPPAGLSLALHKHVKMSVGKLLMETIHSHNVHIPEDQICF